MLHGFYKKEKVNFGMNLTQFQTLCKDMRLSFPVMNKAPPPSSPTPHHPAAPTTLAAQLVSSLCVLRPIPFRSVLLPCRFPPTYPLCGLSPASAARSRAVRSSASDRGVFTASIDQLGHTGRDDLHGGE